jgi:hypothetical protein
LLDTREMGVVEKAHPDPRWIDRPQIILIKRDGDGEKEVVDLTEKDEKGQFKRSIVKTLDPNQYDISVTKYFL